MEEQQVVTQHQFGGPEVLQLENRAVPEPLPTEVRVRVLAAGVNPVDAKTRAGAGMAHVLGAPPFVLGWDVAGVVDAIGYGVTRFAVGDRVLGMPWFPREGGAYAQFVTAPSRQFVGVPGGVDELEAGALPLAGLTAWQALVDLAEVRQGQRVLVHAAAGGVGHLAAQIASSLGAWVAGTASSANHAFLRDLGVDEPIDYREVGAVEAAGPFDVVLDLVGGDVVSGSLPTLTAGGLYVSVAGRVSDELRTKAGMLGVRIRKMLVEPDAVGLGQLVRLMTQGELSVTVSRAFSFEEAASAHAAIESGHTQGKLVLQPPETNP